MFLPIFFLCRVVPAGGGPNRCVSPHYPYPTDRELTNIATVCNYSEHAPQRISIKGPFLNRDLFYRKYVSHDSDILDKSKGRKSRKNN